MSEKGKYLRGEKWFHLNRDNDGELLPVVSEDENKMKDVNVYLETVKKSKKKTKSKGKK